MTQYEVLSLRLMTHSLAILSQLNHTVSNGMRSTASQAELDLISQQTANSLEIIRQVHEAIEANR
jgi:hypothetical protein